MNWIWQTWKNPEWIHLLVSCVGVRVGRTWGVNPILCAVIVFALGFMYEVIVDYLIKRVKASWTDLLADAIGSFAGMFV